ncbi:glutathione S-transferase family protein [Aurantivibrio infirmus]
MALVLYQFPISHFCEKVRWALDYKGLEYKKVNLLPGLHVKTTTKIAKNSSVPVLEHDGKFIQGSGKIISYLDDKFPEKKLSPPSSLDVQAALEWERYLDNEFGLHVRRYVYHTLLKKPDPVIGFFASGGPFWAKPMLRFMFSKLSKKMRSYMEVNEESAAKSKQHIEKALKRLNEALVGKEFLVGTQFTRADLSAAALLAPLFMPAKYGLDWPEALPEPLQSEVTAMGPQLQWAKDIYQAYR